MFPRISEVRRGDKVYQYLKIVETYRDNGRHRQRVIANLGRYTEELAVQVDQLIEGLSRFGQRTWIATDQIQAEECLMWGPVLVARHLWDQLELGSLVQNHCRSPRQRLQVAERTFVLLANRLTEPTSEHGLARWLEHTFVCDSHGVRWEPAWRPPEQVTPQQRVKVTDAWLNGWYRTLDALLRGQAQIEQGLYRRVRDLFHLDVDLVFYDLTSTYFQRRTPIGQWRRHGKSKDGHPREVQVLVGVVMANGFPIAHHVFAGNQVEHKTLPQVITDVRERFGLRRVMVVADRGLVSSENLDWLSNQPFRYLLALKDRRNAQARAVLDALEDEELSWVRVDSENRVQSVQLPGEAGRFFVVESEPRMAYEQEQRARSMQRIREKLEQISATVQAGRLKDPVKIAARAARALSGNHGSRYFSYQVPGRGEFTFAEDPAKMAAEQRREGRYILRSDDGVLTPAEAVETYKQLFVVEDGFRDLKDVIEMRPVWHRCDDRIRAHIFVATLCLFLKRALQHQLNEQGVYLSATDALAAVKSIGLAELNVNGEHRRIVSRPKGDAQRVLRALGIRTTDPPSPQPRQQTH